MPNPTLIPTQIAERFAAGELVTAIAQDAESKDVLMLAWMNQQALAQTLETGRVTYWSRSRNEPVSYTHLTLPTNREV